MYIYAELWRFRPAWLELSDDERKSWMDELLSGIGEQLESGVEVVAFIANDEDTPHSSGFDFLAVWKMPDKETAQRFETFVEESGLHDYYEQVNTRGTVLGMEKVVSALLNV
jgi:hypothetical protein